MNSSGSRSLVQPQLPKTPFRHSTYTPSQYGSASRLDSSNSALAQQSVSNRLFPDTPSNRATFSSSAHGGMQKNSFFAQTISEEEEDVTVATRGYLQEEDPGAAACQHLFEDFLTDLRQHSTQQSVFELVASYEQTCGQVVSALWKLVNRSLPVHGRLNKTCEVLALIVSEQQTWRLVVSLYRDRIDSESQKRSMENEPMSTNDCTVEATEKDITNSLFAQDANLRQAQLIVDWLEFNAEKQLENHYNKVEFSVDRMGAWEDTLHVLNTKKSANISLTSRNMVDQLDPDAPFRQGKRLSDLDVEDDTRLLNYIFCCIRSGHIDEAYKVCAKVGQVWRAATLEGWRLYHDPNVKQLGPGGTVQAVEGNRYRDIWKRSCWKLSQQETVSVVERAIYAALSGNLDQLLPCCSSWHDQVWAYFRVLVDQTVESNIRELFTGPRPLVELPPSYTDKRLSYENIFNEIQVSPVEEVRIQAQYRFNQIQKFIILSDIDGLSEAMHEWCRKDDIRPHQHLVRFMAHLILFFRTLGLPFKEEIGNEILETYIGLLIDDNHVDLIATYVAKLPNDRQTSCYAKFLEGVNGTELRRHCLDLAKESGLNLAHITRLVVENIRERDTDLLDSLIDSEAPPPTLEVDTTEDDYVKINAIEWLTFDPSHRTEALHQANAIMRVFIIRRKLAACRSAMQKLPNDTIDVIMKSWKEKAGDSADLTGSEANAIREHLCITAFLDGEESFSDWFKHYHNARPSAPQSRLNGNFSECVAFEHLEKQYNVDLDRWQHSLDHITRVTVEKIYNVLLFIDGGWMIDHAASVDCMDEIDADRIHQMKRLREICLPSLCFILHRVLHTTQQYKQCIQLADYIASEQHQLYRVFNKNELQKLMDKFRESSIALLDAGQDPFGYPLHE